MFSKLVEHNEKITICKNQDCQRIDMPTIYSKCANAYYPAFYHRGLERSMFDGIIIKHFTLIKSLLCHPLYELKPSTAIHRGCRMISTCIVDNIDVSGYFCQLNFYAIYLNSAFVYFECIRYIALVVVVLYKLYQ